MSQTNKKNKTDIWSLIITSVTILILVSVLVTLLSGVFTFQQMSHNQKLEQLKLEKEIALINNPYNSNTEYADLNLLIRSIDKIKKDCGSTQIAKKYGSNDWSVFLPLEPNPWLDLSKCYTK